MIDLVDTEYKGLKLLLPRCCRRPAGTMSMLGTAALPEPSPPAPTPADPLPDDDEVEIAAPAPGERRVFRYWEYESRYLATKPDGWEPPEVNSIDGGRGIRLGISLDDVTGKIHRTNGMIDSSRWEHDNRKVFASAGFAGNEYLRQIVTAEGWIDISVGTVSADICADNALPLDGGKAVTRRSVGMQLYWCFARVNQSTVARSLADQIPEVVHGMLSNVHAVVGANGQCYQTANPLGGPAHRAYERTVMGGAEADGRWLRAHPPRGRPRVQPFVQQSHASSSSSSLTVEQRRFQQQVSSLPGPTPLTGAMVEMLQAGHSRLQPFKYFKLSTAMWKVVCIKIDALGGFQKGSWDVFRKAIAYVEENFPENVPAGKLQVQAVAKHYIDVWKRPRILDANGRRSYLPSSAMIHVIACVRGTMRYPVEMNSRLLRPVIVATLTTVDGGIYRTLLSQHGGAFNVSADWINKLCVTLRLPYKR